MTKKKGWVHPTGKSPKRIAIVGLGPTSHDWHAAHVQYTPPLPPVDEVWTVNKGFRTVKADLVFIMDDLIEEARKSPRYGDDIAHCTIPVITSTVDGMVKERFPKALKYPLDEVLRFWGAHIHHLRTEQMPDSAKWPLEESAWADAALQYGLNECAYWNNSIPYMLAYAGAVLPDLHTICLFGCDYTFPGSAAREDDRANAEYWIAACQFGLGMGFTYPHRTTILNRDKGRQFYGFNGRMPY